MPLNCSLTHSRIVCDDTQAECVQFTLFCLAYHAIKNVQSRWQSTSVPRRLCRQCTATYGHPTIRSTTTRVTFTVAAACAPPVVSSSASSTCRRSLTRTRPAVRRRRPTWYAWRRPTGRSVVATAVIWSQVVCRRPSTRDELTPWSSSWRTVIDERAASGSPTPVCCPSTLFSYYLSFSCFFS